MKFILFFTLLIITPFTNTTHLKTPEFIKANSTITYINPDEIEFKPQQTTIPLKLKEALFLYLQFFLLFTLLSILRLNEEMFKIISLYIDNKYSNFIDLNNLNADDYDGCYAYVSGTANILKQA